MSFLFLAIQMVLACPNGCTSNSSRLIMKLSAELGSTRDQHRKPGLVELQHTRVKEGSEHGQQGHTQGFLEAWRSRQILKSEASGQSEALGQKYESSWEKQTGSASAFISKLELGQELSPRETRTRPRQTARVAMHEFT